MPGAVFKLDLAETFPRLSHAPIVEAVIHWQARAQHALDPDSLRADLAQKLPQYVKCDPLQQMELTAMVSNQEPEPIVRHQKGWHGFRLTSEDGRQIVQFKRDGVVFSRTQPYEHWEPFAEAAKEAWHVFCGIAAPLEVQRLGVRYIYHVAAVTAETVGAFLHDPPTCPSNLPLKEFVYQSTFGVPDQPFGVRVIKVMQPTMPELPQSSGLFLDIDVYSTKSIPSESGALNEILGKMRWLKNKVFFTLLTEGAVQSFQ